MSDEIVNLLMQRQQQRPQNRLTPDFPMRPDTEPGWPDDTMPKSWWGPPRTTHGDGPWYLPKDMVSDQMYRHQGSVLHGAMMLMNPGATTAFKIANALLNGGYAAGTQMTGRTEPDYSQKTNLKFHEDRMRRLGIIK